MKKILYFVFPLAILCACNSSKSAQTGAEAPPQYPTDIQAIFQKHGGIKQWAKMKTLYFEIAKPDGNDKLTIDLPSRCDLVESAKATIGFDGTKAWVLEKGEPYKGKAQFMHNLMFYFFAMPFVLGDKGIKYEKTADLVVQGKTYSGYKIVYDAGVGASSDDSYFLYFDTATKNMEWLGYTATFGSGKPSDKVNFIRYDDWKTVNGLALPNSIGWYKVENGVPTTLRNKVSFAQVKISETAMPKTTFAKPEQAKYAQ